MQYDVFLSYVSNEQELAKKMSLYLEYYNIRCFIACRDMPVELSWTENIVNAIKESRMIVVLFSDAFNSSSWTDNEIKLAKELGKPLLTFRTVDSVYGEIKNKYLKGTVCIDAFSEPENMLGNVYEEVCSFLGLPIEPSVALTDIPEFKENVVIADGITTTDIERTNGTDIPAPLLEEVRSGHHMFRTFIIGVALAIIVVLFLEWIMG